MAANNVKADIELGELSEDKTGFQVKDILKQTDFLTGTIDDFKNFYTPTKSKENVTFDEILSETKQIVSLHVRHHDITLDIENSSTKQLLIYKRELIQVLLNIINNAVDALKDHTEPNKSITIRIIEDDDHVYCSVCDNGGGIDDSILHEIFTPYFTTKDVSSGTGLGLYISKTITEKHLNGTITVSNNDGGACFMITLPLNEQPQPGDK